VRLVDGSAGLSAATIKRRLAAVSALFGYLVVRGDCGVVANPVPRGLPTRQHRRGGPRVVPLVRGVRRLPRILGPAEVEGLLAALRTDRDRAIVQAMLLAGLRRCEVLGLRLEDLRLGEWRVFIAEGKGGYERLVPMSTTFFATVASYLNCERPTDATTDRVFVVLKGPTRGDALSAAGLDEVLAGRGSGRVVERDVSRVASHLFHSSPRSRHGHRSAPSARWSPVDRINPGVSASRRRVARR
jgi:integrase